MNKKKDVLSGSPLPVFFYYAIPSIFGMVAQSSASVIDAAFLGNYVGTTALAAVNLTVPFWALLGGIEIMFATGGAVICGKYLGQERKVDASVIFTNTLLVIVSFGLFATLFGLLFADQLVLFFGVRDPVLAATARTYIIFCLPFEAFLMTYLCLAVFIRVDGYPVIASGLLTAAALLNILLDWILIVVFGMGVEGAALATGLSHTVAAFISIWFFINYSSLKIIWRKERLKEVLTAAYNGFSEFTNDISAGILIFVFNRVMIARMGVEGVAAFTVVTYVLFVGNMISYGVCDAMQPILSKNFGAGNSCRIKFFLGIAGITVFLVGLIFILLIFLVPNLLIDIFLETDNGKTEIIVLGFFAIFWPAFFFNGANLLISEYFTTMHKPLHSSLLAVSRSMAFPLVFLFTLPYFWGDTGIYLSIPLAELCTFIIAISILWLNRPSIIVGSDKQRALVTQN